MLETVEYRLNRMTKPGGRIQRIFQKRQKHKVSTQPLHNRVIHISCDDHGLKPSKTAVKQLRELRRSYPDLKVTMFTVPQKIKQRGILNETWIQAAVHGWKHDPLEIWSDLTPYEAYRLLGRAIKKFKTLNLTPNIFKPPRYRSNPSLEAILGDLGFRYAFLSNDQYTPLIDEAITPKKTTELTLIPTNYSIWFKDPNRLNAILDHNGYLSIQSHTNDYPRWVKNLWWLLEQVDNYGGYVFESFTSEVKQ